jgi:hypothetical protein
MEPDFGFGEAIARLKAGKRVARKGWNGPNQNLMLQVPESDTRIAREGKIVFKMSLPYIFITTVQGDLVPWLASQTDVLAEDWFEVGA